jgi:hypothetical protein
VVWHVRVACVWCACGVQWLGAFHGANEELFWRSTPQQTATEMSLGDRMVAHWTSFVRTGAPLATWPAAVPNPSVEVPDPSDEVPDPSAAAQDARRATDRYLLLSKHGDAAGAGWHSERCDALDRLRVIWDPPYRRR